MPNDPRRWMLVIVVGAVGVALVRRESRDAAIRILKASLLMGALCLFAGILSGWLNAQ